MGVGEDTLRGNTEITYTPHKLTEMETPHGIETGGVTIRQEEV